MAYVKQNWENLPSTNTPITAERLNHIEDGIAEAWEHGGGDTSSLMETLGLDVNTYDDTAEYVVGDIVVYNNNLYKCISNTSGDENPEDFLDSVWSKTSYFEIISSKLLNRFAVINETVIIPASQTSIEHYINFPTGFTKHNCVIISSMVDDGVADDPDTIWSSTHDLIFINGNMATPKYMLELGDTWGENPNGITLTISLESAFSRQVERHFKIVLMRTDV